MQWRIILASVFCLQILFGSICTIPKAFAAESPKVNHMEMVMTPVLPMTPIDCEGCILVEIKEEHMTKGIACPSGQCLLQGMEATMGLVSFGGKESSSPQATSTALAWSDVGGEDHLLSTSPLQVASIPKISLRL